MAQTVREFNYYMGHGGVSMSRLHVNMFATPPRVIQSTAPKATEMRGIMSQMRSMHQAHSMQRQQQAGECGLTSCDSHVYILSGYNVEITHTDDRGRERVTRATVHSGRPGLFGMINRGMGGAMGGAMGGGIMEALRQRRQQEEESVAGGEAMETEQAERPARQANVTISAMNAFVNKESDAMETSGSSGGAAEREDGETENAIPDYLARLIAHMVAGVPMEPEGYTATGNYYVIKYTY